MTREEAHAELEKLQRDAKRTTLEDIKLGMSEDAYKKACADILAALTETEV